ncbi:MAG TPA: bacteriophage spanin2 family protein [Actinophytocola sp.]|uniref:bacteriophage spanin2 family protein n=1 Tax=Actinophytocola sp. TaxID=1872138 RepID=UPI002DB86E1A|nr:bacteriophage spanin2 family protein [Actinophytocola sp.]HEU5473922.1 bacteriophage spanin2 family protein [Actinophytocola sp.]
MIARIGLAVLVVLALTGCETVQQAGEVADKAGICADALRLSGFVPDVGNPEKAAEDAKRTAEDLRQLAEQAPDETLRNALEDMSNKVSELNPGNINPGAVADWVSDKVGTVEALARACG